ncbi:conserved Plasmodium protein, unknown function [Babesia microti strain RI]|uniref:CS domain-containing protein n=1 Tax=Babesia microti (strain RI) TaxID=1133968 RepID=I7J696_BABMR|nr:conserved Plasmodium protein, unknown function [Babesia microti strain RI]CCF73602.1 conserved Plasmodium protein, unknown function [Babesia microti strain RI]|eukprot:XP_012648211.1 conserved Plasmodium protein, unknown function [Babesia microti strain RI]
MITGLLNMSMGLKITKDCNFFIHQNRGYVKKFGLPTPIHNITNSYKNIRQINSLSAEEEEKLEDLLGKKVSRLSKKELLDEIINENDPVVNKIMGDIFDINNLPSLERTETLQTVSRLSKKELLDEIINENDPVVNKIMGDIFDINNLPSLERTETLQTDDTYVDDEIVDKDFYDPTVGEFKMKYTNEEERINIAKNAVAHILEDNMVLVVPIKKIIVKNEHIDTLFWRDSHKHIEIWIPLRHSISCKDLKINFSTKDIKITNGDLTLLELPLPGPIRADECVWESDNRSFPELPIEALQTLHIVLTKRASHEHIWKSLLRK